MSWEMNAVCTCGAQAGKQTLLVPSAAVHPCGSVDLHDVQRTASTPPAGESWLGLNGEWVR